MRGCARGAGGNTVDGIQDRQGKKIIFTGGFPSGTRCIAGIEGAGRVVLNPLTKIRVRMLMTVGVRCGQLMMNILSYREWGQDKQQEDYAKRYSPTHQ